MSEEKKELLPEETENPVQPEETPDTEQKIIPEQGIDTEKYEVSEPWLDGKRVDDSVSGLKIAYDLKGEEVKRALKYFQKRTLHRKNTIFTIILAVIAALYAQAIYTNPSYTMGYLMLVLALSVIFFMWYLPSRHIKSAAEAADLADDTYHLEICSKGLLMPQEDGRYLVGFDRPSIRAVEFTDMYLILASKEKVFALPKRCIPPDDQKELTEILKDALGARYELVTE